MSFPTPSKVSSGGPKDDPKDNFRVTVWVISRPKFSLLGHFEASGAALPKVGTSVLDHFTLQLEIIAK